MSRRAELVQRIRAGLAVSGERVGNFELLEPLAGGGQSVVALARHQGLGHRVALKLLDPAAPAADPERLRQEGQLLIRLAHPSLPRPLDLGEDRGLHYLALELIEGEDLEELVGRELPAPAWAAARLAEVADALEHCHQAGLVHRDVKPPNVIVRRSDQRAVLCDFGLARREQGSTRFASVEALALSRSGEIKGSPEFMAPEQADPEDYGPAGPAADVHGLGATLFYALTGSPPFGGETTQSLLDDVRYHEPPPPSRYRPEIPEWIDALCAKALAKEPERRFASAAAFAAAVRSGLASGSAEDLVELDELSESAAPVAPKKRKRDSGRTPRRPRSARLRGQSSASGVTGALGLESADELPAYRPSATPPPPRPPERSQAGAWGLALGIVGAFAGAGAATLQWGPSVGGALFAAAIVPLGGALVLWGGVGARRPVLRRRARAKASEPAPERRAALFERARALVVEKRDPSAALVLLDDLLREHPHDAAALVLRGRARVARGELAAGALDLDLALELDPHDALACAERGALRFRLGDVSGACADFDRALELDPSDAGAWASRGACHYKARDYPAALADFDRCLELSPDDLELHRRRGRVRFKARDFTGACADWSAVLERLPEDRDALRKRAVAWHRLGRPSEAAADEARLAELEGA